MSEAATPLTATKSSAAPSSEINGDAGAQWAGCWAEQFPLRAKGRNLVNTRGDRYKLCGINWYGASDALHVVGGLRNQPLADICAAVSAMGFTAVRLPFSNEMLTVREVPPGAIDYALNPELRDKTPLQVYDCVVDGLGAAKVAVILNNHTTLGMWSGGVEANGLWFQEDSATYTEVAWIEDWAMLAQRYSDRPWVVAYDLRNEVRPVNLMRKVKWPHWGLNEDKSSAESIWESGRRNSEANAGERNAVDWARASGACARRIVGLGAKKAPGVIVLERTAWPQEPLQLMLSPRPPWDEAYGLVNTRAGSSKEANQHGGGPLLDGRNSGVARNSSSTGNSGGGGLISGTLRNWGRSKSLTDSSSSSAATNERASKGILGSATAAAMVAVAVGTAPVLDSIEAENQSDDDNSKSNSSGCSRSTASSSASSSSSSESGRNILSSGAMKPSMTRSTSSRLKQPPFNSKLTPRTLAQKSRDSASFSQGPGASTPSSRLSQESISSSSTGSGFSGNSSQGRSQSPRHRNLRSSSESVNSTNNKRQPPPKRVSSLRKRTNQKVQSQPLKRGPSFNTGGPFRTVPRDRVMLSVHSYAWSGPGAWSPKAFTAGVVHGLLSLRDWASGLSLYGEMLRSNNINSSGNHNNSQQQLASGDAAAAASSSSTATTLEQQFDKEWGWCLKEDVVPVWLSEFGGDLTNAGDVAWLRRTCAYLEAQDADFCYWPLNVGPKAGHGSDPGTSAGDESYGLLTNDWRPRWHDERLRLLRRCAPSDDAPQRAGHAPSLLGLSNIDSTSSSSGNSSSNANSNSGTNTSSIHHDTSWLNAAVATALSQSSMVAPPRDWPVRLPLAWAPSPWCGPLPGPLIPWPGDPVLPAYTPQNGEGDEDANGSAAAWPSQNHYGGQNDNNGRGGKGSSSGSTNTKKKPILPRKRSTSSHSPSSSSSVAAAYSRRSSAPAQPSRKKGTSSSSSTNVAQPYGSSSGSGVGNSAVDSRSLLSPPAAALASALLHNSAREIRSDIGLLNDAIGMGFPFEDRPGDGLLLPQPRYFWKVTQGIDADPGENADEFCFDDLPPPTPSQSSHVNAIKQTCVLNGFGGFVTYKGTAYMRAATSEALHERAQEGFPNSVLFLPEEVRLCALPAASVSAAHDDNNSSSTPQPSGLSTEVPASVAQVDSTSPASAQAEHNDVGTSGTEKVEIVQPSSAAPLSTRPSQPPLPPLMTPLAARKALAAVEGMQLVRMGVGLKAWPERDVYPGANAFVLKPSVGMGGFGSGSSTALSIGGGGSSSPNWSLCRAICLANGFGGFAVSDGIAYFRTATPDVLNAALVASASTPEEANSPKPHMPMAAVTASGTTFYVLTVRPLAPPRPAAGSPSAERRDRRSKMPRAPPMELWTCPPPDYSLLLE